MCWVFIATRGLSLVAVSRGFALVEACRLLVALASLVAEYMPLGQEGFSPWGWRFLQHGFRTCALWAKLLLTCGIFPDRDLTCVLCFGRWAHNHSSWGVQFLVFLEKFAVRFLTTHAIFRSLIIFSLYLKSLSFITDF